MPAPHLRDRRYSDCLPEISPMDTATSCSLSTVADNVKLEIFIERIRAMCQATGVVM
jgi:hypothetical protein